MSFEVRICTAPVATLFHPGRTRTGRTAALLALLMLAAPAQSAIYKCTDAVTGNVIYSSSPCDGVNQRPLSVLQESDLQERDSTFDGASLKRRAESLERQKSSRTPAGAVRGPANAPPSPAPAEAPTTEPAHVSPKASPSVTVLTPLNQPATPAPAVPSSAAPSLAAPVPEQDANPPGAAIRYSPIVKPAPSDSPKPPATRQRARPAPATPPPAPAAAGATTDAASESRGTIRYSRVVRPADEDAAQAQPHPVADAAPGSQSAAAPDHPPADTSAQAAPQRRFAAYCRALLQERDGLRPRLQASENEEESAWLRRQLKELAEKLTAHDCFGGVQAAATPPAP